MQAHYELLQELGIAVPPMEFAAYQTMEGDVLLMQDAVYSAEANKELYIQRFKVSCFARASHKWLCPKFGAKQLKLIAHMLC